MSLYSALSEDIERFEEPYLVQILKKIPSDWEDSIPHAFGGGLRYGGLSEEAYGRLTNIFAFEYMGIAEYEHGGLPSTLNRITENQKNYIGFAFDILNENVKRYNCDDSTGKIQDKYTIYVICHKKIKNDYEKYFRSLAAKGIDRRLDLIIFQVVPRWTPIGGLDENNSAFFFVDKEIFDKTRALWNIEVS